MPVSINVDPLLTGNHPDFHTCARSVMDALATQGLMVIEAPSLLPVEKCQSIMNASKTLFNLGLSAKMDVKMKGFTRGYIPAGGESGSQQLEWKEGFAYGYSVDTATECPSPLHASNEWPTGLGLQERDLLLSFYKAASDICLALSRAISVALDQPSLYEECLDGRKISLMRLFHYFPTSEQHQNAIGSSEHTDWGFLTLIMQDLVGGLEFLDSNDKTWKEVPASSIGGLIVNCGDFLSMMTKGQLKSPLHRVQLSHQHHRYSLVYFFYPSFHSQIPDAVHQQRYSLLTNQSSNLENAAISKLNNFGEFIIEKWQQVNRL